MAEELKQRKRRKRKRCRTVKKTKWVDGKRKTVKVRKCKPRKRKPQPPGSTHPPAPVVTPPAPGPAPPVPPAPPAPRLKIIRSPIPVYKGPFGPAQAERLLWRAGFGPRPGEVESLSKLTVEQAVRRLTRPRSRALSGPAPVVDGLPLAPLDVWGHDVLWWLDRMVRSDAPLIERMTLVWHDWFATAGQDAKWMINQN